MKYLKKIFLSIIVVLAIIEFAYLFKNYNEIKITRVTTLDSVSIPAEIKQYVLKQQESTLLLIYFDGSRLYAYTKNSGDYTTAAALIVESLKKIASSSEYKLFRGYYLISLRDGEHERLSWPILSFATTNELVKNKNVILIPDHQALKGYDKLFAKIDMANYKYPWEIKLNKIFWRGGPSIDSNYNKDNFNDNIRLKFVDYARKFNFTDVGIANGNLTIHPNFKKKLIDREILKSPVLPAESMIYKYLFDIDGYSCSYSRMAWILYSNSALMKHTSDKVQWYYDKLQPYVNYIPIAEDFSNLQDQFLWAEANQEKVKNIAQNGRTLAQETFSETSILRAMENAFIQYYNLTNSNLIMENHDI